MTAYISRVRLIDDERGFRVDAGIRRCAGEPEPGVHTTTPADAYMACVLTLENMAQVCTQEATALRETAKRLRAKEATNAVA